MGITTYPPNGKIWTRNGKRKNIGNKSLNRRTQRGQKKADPKSRVVVPG